MHLERTGTNLLEIGENLRTIITAQGKETPLANLTGNERARYVEAMFTRIAPRYDLMNRLMTFGQDVRWRQEVIRRARLEPRARVLDLGAGTGDLSREALSQQPSSRPTAADFTRMMMQVGRRRMASDPHAARQITWAGADALHLPFPEESFNAVVSGFLLRNLGDVPASLAEQYRVLKPGGRWVALDTSPPPDRSLLTPLMDFHLHTVIPWLGTLLTGQAEAYQYLPSSTEGFLEPERLAGLLLDAGFRQVGFHKRMFGAVAVYWGSK